MFAGSFDRVTRIFYKFVHVALLLIHILRFLCLQKNKDVATLLVNALFLSFIPDLPPDITVFNATSRGLLLIMSFLLPVLTFLIRGCSSFLTFLLATPFLFFKV